MITPSHTMFEKLLEINKRVGSAEGGDQVKRNYGYVRHGNVDCNVNAIYILYYVQGVLNNGLCPHWFFADNGIGYDFYSRSL